MELKRNKLLPVGQNTPNPNTPSPPNRIKAREKTDIGASPGVEENSRKTSFGSDNKILDFDFLCMFWISFGAEVCPASLASPAGKVVYRYASFQFSSFPSLSRV